MKFVRALPDHVNVNKASLYAMAVNFLQIAAAAGLALFILLDTENTLTLLNEVLVLLLTALVIFGGVMDIREAWLTRRMTVKMRGLDETVHQMNDLNIALRTQRHDFLNHLQVVYGLLEMEEYQEACRYIEQVYGDIQSVSRVLKTACAPVNALLRAKTAELGQSGVTLSLQVSGQWKDLPLPGWEMCRVLSNLIDNARDALHGQKNGQVMIRIHEDLRQFSFSVENNGPRIPGEILRVIFEPGISQKGEGRGMGLHIARETLRHAGGDLVVETDESHTVFSGYVPRRAKEEKSV